MTLKLMRGENMEIKSVNGLIREHERMHPNSYFFDKESLKFFGERISEMRLLKDRARIKSYSGDVHTCYILSALQRKHPSGPRRAYHYFDTETLDRILPDE